MEIKGIKYVGPILDGCYDSKTEVLTDSGWKFFKDVKYEDFICTLNKEGVIEYHIPENIITKEWKDDMYIFKSQYSKIDLLVTPDHSMLVQTESSNRKSKSHGWRFEKAEEIFNKSRYLKKNADYIKKDLEYITLTNNNINDKGFKEVYSRKIKTDDWLEFLGYYISEGSSTLAKNGTNYIVQIRQYGKDLDKMASALSKVTVGKVNIIHENGRAIVHDKELCLYLRREQKKVYEKNIPRYILNNCSKRQLDILFEALMLGDGHDQRGRYEVGEMAGGSTYHTASLQLREDFMELLLKIGYSGSFTKVHSKDDVIYIYDRKCIAGADNWVVNIRFKNNVCGKIKLGKGG